MDNLFHVQLTLRCVHGCALVSHRADSHRVLCTVPRSSKNVRTATIIMYHVDCFRDESSVIRPRALRSCVTLGAPLLWRGLIEPAAAAASARRFVSGAKCCVLEKSVYIGERARAIAPSRNRNWIKDFPSAQILQRPSKRMANEYTTAAVPNQNGCLPLGS